MSYYPREVVDCYLDKKFEELLNVPNAVYVASVAKDIAKDLFYIERGIAKKNSSVFAKEIPIPKNQELEDCIDEYNKREGLIPKGIKIEDYDNGDFVEDLDVEPFELQVTDKHIRPVSGGCGIGHEFSPAFGTLGAILHLKYIDAKYIISNYHVLSNKNFKEDNLIFQPATVHSRMVDYKNVIAKLKYGHFGDYVDVAFAEVLYDDEVEAGTIWNNDPINGIGIPKINDEVEKSGMRTKTTCGKIRSTNAYVKFKNPWRKNDKKVILQKQILTTKMSDKGDSGSILLNKNREAVGLLIGGDKKNFSIYNNFKYIFNSDYPNMENLEFDKFVQPKSN